MGLVRGSAGRALGALLAVWLAAACGTTDARRISAGQDGPTTSREPADAGQPTTTTLDEAVSIEVVLGSSLQCQPGDVGAVVEHIDRRPLTEEELRSPDPEAMTPESAMRRYLVGHSKPDPVTGEVAWPEAKNLVFKRWESPAFERWTSTGKLVVMRYQRGSATRGVATLDLLPNGQWSIGFFAACSLTLTTKEAR